MLRTLVKHTTTQFSGRFVTALLSFLTTFILARFLGAHYYGEYTKVLSYIMFFYILTDFGLNAIFVRETRGAVVLARQKLPAFISLRLVWGTFLTLLAVFGIWVLSFLSSGFSPLVRTTTILITPALLWYSLYLAAQALFQVELRFVRSAVALVVGSVVSFGFILVASQVVVPESEKLVLFSGLAFVIGAAVTTLVAGFFTNIRVSLSTFTTHKNWRVWFTAAAPLGFMLFFNLIYFRIDTLLLTFWRPSSEIGAYGYAYKFFEFAIAIPTFAMNSAFPLLSKLDVNSPALRQAFIKLFAGLTIAAVLVVGIGWVGAPLIVIRPDFSDSVAYVRTLLVGAPVFFLTSPLMWLFILLNKQRLLMVLYLLAMGLNIGANYLWIPIYGATASAIITGLTELFVLVGGVVILVVNWRRTA
ncbi:TPA: hypothetical protein DIV55_05865 [Patescibacteria group bacterium]|uniref:Polysaccharide biosynthesis protein n=1 Tax=Candidatus Gottesmanbacteria bacterium GW2011_GWA1_43_11 TaxID=1618436 RepID=A0A0G1FFE7_9BACT|nr:MAG: Polysaccharide biosynthesis protein [Candidatus Gottesmanbacteria bacterium GW2011_GWA1_43_11]HCS79234.1 hypothetical protein [Patescibacteria group bacterium]